MYLKPVSVHTVIPASGCSTHFSLFGLNLSVPCCCTPMILKGLGGKEQKVVPEDSTPCLKDEVVVGLFCEATDAHLCWWSRHPELEQVDCHAHRHS